MIKLIPVSPIGSHWAFDIEVIDYPPQCAMSAKFRDARRNNGMTIRQASDLLGIRSVELSGLENGKSTLSVTDWDLAISEVSK